MISFLTFLLESVYLIIFIISYMKSNHGLSTKNLKITFKSQGDQDKCVSSSSFKWKV